MNKLLVISGPTATGKTELGIHLAQKYNGEIISADSRQVYKGMDVITGKDLPAESKLQIENDKLQMHNSKFDVGYRLKNGIPVWLVDIVEPDYPFSAGEYALLAYKIIIDIWSRGKLPVIVGGTGFYIRAIIDPIETVQIRPDKRLRSILEKYDKAKLQKTLMESDLKKWENMNNSDRENPRRLIRAIEVAHFRQNKMEQSRILTLPDIESLLMVCLKAPIPTMYERIDKRVEMRIENGAVEEVKTLMKKDYSWNLPAFSTAGCKELREYAEGKESLTDTIKYWQFNEHNYAKRQMTWFRKEKRFKWFDISDRNFREEIEETVKKWYTLVNF